MNFEKKYIAQTTRGISFNITNERSGGIGMYLHGFEKRILPENGHQWVQEMGAGGSLSHWIIGSAVYLQPIKMLTLSTELFSVLTQSGWSFALCIA